jgi:SAM-dependent methyltransferase
MPELPLSKLIEIEDFRSPELSPYLVEVNSDAASQSGTLREDVAPDSKQWECAMTLRALDRAGVAGPGRMIAGIGVGTEVTMFALARRDCLVFAVDRYLHRSVWSDVAPAGMMIDPARYSALPFPRGHVIPVNGSGLQVNLPTMQMDAVFSTGAIEHFGSLERVAIAAREFGRILRPGGIAVISTQFRIDGPADLPWFSNDVILFTPELLERWVIRPSGLSLETPIEYRQSDRTFEGRQNSVDFRRNVQTIHTLEEKRSMSPNVVLYHDGFLFCSLVLVLRKPMQAPTCGTAEEADLLKHAEALIASENAELAAELEHLQRSPMDGASSPQVAMGDVQALQAEIDRLHQALERATAWKRTAIMRPVRALYRRLRKPGP